MSPGLYQPVFLMITGVISLFVVFRYISSPDFRYQSEVNGMALPTIMAVVFVFWLGMRPVSMAFGDTINYARGYYALDADTARVTIDWHAEWIWGFLMVTSKSLGLSVSAFFTIIEAGYILSVLWAVKRFMPTNPMLGMLFVYTSLMFFTFGTNGLRNGLACHVMLLAMSFFFDDKYKEGVVCCLIAFGIHRSVILPIAAMLAARYVVKNMKMAIYFWLASIAVSFVAGGSAISFFSSLGFDDRMSAYNTAEYAEQFNRTGFRWDFLLYSSFPILMGWFVCVKKKIEDDWYKTLCITYCLCNAFWVMVIRAAFSNRFAYLSWFMYPIVIAYPLINLPVWEEQDRKTALILAMYCGFTLFMQLVYW